MPKITKTILEQYRLVEQSGLVDMDDMQAVKAYAINTQEGNMMELAGWLSFYGDKHYNDLVMRPQGYIPIEKPEEETQDEIDISVQNAEPYQALPPRAPRTYYVDKIRNKIRKVGG